MVVIGTTKKEEEALRAAAAASNDPRLSYVSSTDASTLSAYETASEFSDLNFNEARPFQPELDAENDDADNETLELGPDDTVTTPRHSMSHLRAEDGVGAPLVGDPLISGGSILEGASAAPAPPIADDGVNPSKAMLGEPQFVLDPYKKASSLLAPAMHSQPLPLTTTMDDEDLILPVQRELPFDPTGMSEDQLNRVVSQRSERGESIVMHRTLTNKTHIDVRDLDYDNEQDPLNPFNWPSWKKWFVTFTIANTCLCVSLGSSLYVAAVPELMHKFHVSQTLTISGLTFYLLGLALGPVVAAPLSEIIGRRYIYLTTFPACMLFAMGVGLSKNIESVLVLRFFCGLIGSPPMALAGGTISDIWSDSPAGMYLAMSLFCLCPFLGPVIGPIVGGFAAEHKNWQWTMWVYLMFCGAVLPFLLACPETFKPALLEARAKKRGINVIKPEFSLKNAITSYLGRPLEMLVVEPIVCFTSIYIAFVFAVLFGFFEAYPIIFRGVYRMDMGVSGLPFIGVGVGLMLGVFLNVVHKQIEGKKKAKKAAETGEKVGWDAPESQLRIVEIGSVFLPISLFWLAWTSRRSVHWIAPTLAGIPFGFGLMWVFLGIISYYAYSFPPAYVASAISANNLLRYLLAAVFPLFVVQMYKKLHVEWATTLFAFISLAMVPIPFVFSKFGERIRLNSKYGYVAYFKAIAAEEAKRKANNEVEKHSTTLSSSHGVEQV